MTAVATRRRAWVGLGFVGLSGAWFALVFLVQLAGFGLGVRALLSATFFCLMEGSFYLGVYLLGRQLAWGYLVRLRTRLGF